MKEKKQIGQLISLTGEKKRLAKLGKVELISFHWFGNQVGSLEFKGEKLRFKGDVDTSAKLLFDRLKEFVEQYIQERLISMPQEVLNKLDELLAGGISEEQQITTIRQIKQLVENLAMEMIEQKREAQHEEEHSSKG